MGIPKKDEETKEQYVCARENAVASLGKIIHLVGASVPNDSLMASV